MGVGLSYYGRRLLTNEAQLRQALDCPLLVWQAPPGEKVEQLLFATEAGAPMLRPKAGEPLVFELKKSSRQNAFAFGVTVGRTENNDVPVEDNSVSRFHAYFQKDARSGEWKVVDAESKNGTWVGPRRLAPNQGEPIQSGAALRFGDIEMKFLLVEDFIALLKSQP